MPVSKMDILRQSRQKQNLDTMQTTRSTIPSTIPSDSPERPKVQTPAWVAENKGTGEKTVRKFNSTTKQNGITPPSPIVVNPLSLSTDSSCKKRLILYLGYVNMHLYKDKIKFDDWKCFENCLPAKKGYLYKFDLKNGYHHIDIFDSCQAYLGFIKRATRYFLFTVLPFCLSSAPFVFTKVVRPLVKNWRLHAVKVACFLEHGLGIAYTYQDALSCSNFVKVTLINSALYQT